MKAKIQKLIKGNFTQAAFTKKSNADYFASLWRKKGYTISIIRSIGKTVEGDDNVKSYYVIADKPTPKVAKKSRGTTSVEDKLRRSLGL